MRSSYLVAVLSASLLFSGCATSSPIQRYSESRSHFGNPPELMSHDYPAKDVYRVFHRASTGFTSIQSIRKAAMRRVDDFAQRQGKSALVLGERISEPPYILGNFPRIEIVFALVDKPLETSGVTLERNKYDELEKLKKLLDEGVLTREEFEKEKAKILK